MILNDDFSLNEEKLDAYGLPWFTTSTAIAKVATSLSFGATITHMALWNGKMVWNAVKSGRKGEVLDREYPFAGLRWYMFVLNGLSLPSAL